MIADFIVVGSGIAGLRAAIELAPAGRVLILTKAEATESNTGYAQGGIAVALGGDDSPELHEADTLRAGDGLCDETAVRVLVEEGPRYVSELVAWGTAFDRDAEGRLARGREAAHSVRRVLHAGDATGREIGRVLWQRARSLASVTTVNHTLVTGLIVEQGAVAGVRFLDQHGAPGEARASATLLASGGAGRVFSDTTNPPVATGDGIALAFEAGASVADLEFVQFHPTALNVPGAPRFLISEALRGDGARLINERGDTFMSSYHADADLAPRDVVARSIVRETERTGGLVYLTLAHLDRAYVLHRFPTIAQMCRQIVGLDLASDRIPVGPAAHYMMGGVFTDEWGRTSMPALFAAGEVACTGVHGANRLASNSLLEGLVFGARAAVGMQGSAPGRGSSAGSTNPPWEPVARASVPEMATQADGPALETAEDIRQLMWRSVGLFRTREGLTAALAKLDDAYRTLCRGAQGSPDLDRQRRLSLTTVARLVARAALRREESRGGHYRQDFPSRDDGRWRRHLMERKDS